MVLSPLRIVPALVFLVALLAVAALGSGPTAAKAVPGGPGPDGPGPDGTGPVAKNLTLAGRGERLLPDATTDVWSFGGYAYIGTYNVPCGEGTGANGSGVRIFDVSNPTKPKEVGFIPSVAGSRANDVKVARMNAGTILVHSNEACEPGGPGGFEIWDVSDPNNRTHLAHVQTDDVNGFLRSAFGFVDFGVHNLFLFKQFERDLVAAVVESEFGNFQVFDITDPANPALVGFWGAEELRMAELGHDPSTVPDLDSDDFGLILQLDEWLFEGYGDHRNRFLHDITVNAEGTKAYLSNWDAGLVLLDIGDPTDPQLVSVALDPSGSPGDGEVNSHAAWPTADGSIVVETEEDFVPYTLTFEIEGEGAFPALEGAFTTPISTLSGQEMSGPTTYVGGACNPGTAPGLDDPVPTGTGIAVVQRGACFFSEKAQNAIDAGYSGLVVFNSVAGGDEIVLMGGDARDIPGVFVGHSTGLTIFGVTDVGELSLAQSGLPISASVTPNDWGGVRVWDYSDPANPVLASTFDTTCSANPADSSCDPRGTYSVHNVIVERNNAYLSWYSNGALILDISDPYNPVETARYHREGPAFESTNGGIQDFWGIYKETDQPWIYASDRNGGLYILKEYGGGSSGRGRP